MTRETSTRNIALFAFIAGVAAVALTVLFTSSKGAQARKGLAGLGRRLRTKTRLLAGRGTRAWAALKEDPADLHPASGQDQRGKAAGVWQDTMDRTEDVVAEPRAPGDVASDLGRP
jgi:hypothetical protein